uniref:Tumor necrosis factor alpha-induced protein 2-like n=1 Tax=Stegastes partitus TaxID=144197 RepID=A0A3B4ZWD9_9TELE
MPILKNLPVRLKGGGPTLENALILRRMSLNITPHHHHHNPFDNDDDIHGNGGHGNHWSPGSSLLDGDVPRDRNPFEDEEDENEANEGKKGGSGGGGSVKGSFKFKSPLKTLGKLGKNLRVSGRSKGGDTPSPQGTPSPGEKKKRGRRSSEGSLLRFAGKYRDTLGSRKESLLNGELNCSESECDSTSRRLSFMKMVGLGKLKKEAATDHSSQGPEDKPVQEEVVDAVKPREPLSVLEILQLVKKRDLLLADTHILELEQECNESDRGGAAQPEDVASPSVKDGGRRKAKDVELLYEELQKELWAVVRESLRSPTAGPNLGLVVQVLQQEEEADKAWATSEAPAAGGPRPRQLKQRWKEAVEEAADGSLPQRAEFTAGELDGYLDRLRARVVEDLGAAKRNVVSIYPEEYQSFQVYVQSYHQAVARRLKEMTDNQLEITDIYSLLDWLHNIYNRDVLGTVCITSPFSRSELSPLLPSETVDRLELDCLNSVRAKVTTELSQVLDEEEKRWMEMLHIEEYQITLAKTVIQRLQVDLERSASINRSLGSRVAQCSLNGLADFLYRTTFSFQQHAFRCAQCDPSVSEDSLRRANKSLDHIVQQGVRVLSERLYLHIRLFFERLVKRKWLSNTEAYEQIEAVIKEDFKKYHRMDSPPYQLLVAEVHRRVVMEYLRSVMRGRIICTSMKMRKRMAGRLRDEGRQIKALFKDLESPSSWLDSALSHISEIIQLEDVPSIQMEVGVLVREFPDVRKKHVSAILNIRGTTRQAERQEILNIVKDIESSDGGAMPLSRDRALFAEVPVTSEVHCLNVGLSRIALTASSCFSTLRPRRKTRTPVQENPDDVL